MPRHLPIDCDCYQNRPHVFAGQAPFPSTNQRRHKIIATDNHLAALDTPFDTFARHLHHIGRYRQCLPAQLGRSHNGLRHGVFRGLIQGCGKAQDVVRRHAVCAVDRHNLGTAIRQRAGFVEDQRADPCHRFERTSTLDQDAEMRGPRQPRHKGHRYGKDQRTRCCHDQHRHRPDRVACKPPRRQSDRDRHQEKPQ